MIDINKAKGCMFGQAVGDADTNAAVAYSILGAKYGFNAIPTKFIDGLYHKDVMTETFEKLIKAIKQ